MTYPLRPFTLILLSLLIVGCDQEKVSESNTVVESDPLPSWNEGSSKSSIIDFVERAKDPEGIYFIPVSERIATFDNDGTLWAENPIYFQLYFALDRIKEMAPDHPEWKSQQPFQGVLENDLAAIAASGEHGLLEIVVASHSGMSTDDFSIMVTDWIATANHPTLNRPFTDLVYQPMLELMDYLQANDFKVFIVSGGGIEFMRPWVEKVYGIPKDRVVGSSIKTEFVMEGENAQIKRLPEIDFIDDKAEKPVAIWRFIGRKPVFAAGNSDGDLQMLQYATSQDNAFALYIHHTDSVREWAYDRESMVGRLDRGLDEAEKRNWTVVDMESDWKTIFPFETRE